MQIRWIASNGSTETVFCEESEQWNEGGESSLEGKKEEGDLWGLFPSFFHSLVSRREDVIDELKDSFKPTASPIEMEYPLRIVDLISQFLRDNVFFLTRREQKAE